MAPEMWERNCSIDESSEIKFQAYQPTCFFPGPWGWICDYRDHVRCRRAIKNLKAILNARTEPITIDAIEAPEEYAKMLIDCKCVTALKMRQLDKKLLKKLNGQTHIRSLQVIFNPKFPKFPAVEALTVDATAINDFKAKDITDNIAIETTRLLIAVRYHSTLPFILAQIEEFFQIEVFRLNMVIEFIVYRDEKSQSWLDKVVNDILKLRELVSDAIHASPSKEQTIVLHFRWSQMESFNSKMHISSMLNHHKVNCDVFDEDPEDYRFYVELPARHEKQRCLLEVCLK